MYTLGIDASHWQPQVDWECLHQAGVRFAILKASQGGAGRDPLLRIHFKGARTSGMQCGVYHWCDPTVSDRGQVENFLRATRELPFDFAAVDVEQYWASWSEKAAGKITRRIEAQRISASALATAEGIRSACGKPVLIYTRASFIHGYAQPMLQWLADWPLWLAHYPYPAGRMDLDWEHLQREHAPRLAGPALPEGCPQWTFWQFSGDRFVLPGCSTALDLNYFNGSPADLAAWCGSTALLETPLSDPEKLSRLWAAHPELAQP